MPEPIFADEDICVDAQGNRVPCGSEESAFQRYAKGNIVPEREAARLGLAGGGKGIAAEEEREAKKAAEIRDRQLKAAAQPAPREPEFRNDAGMEALDAGTTEDRLSAGERKAETAQAVGVPSAVDVQAQRLEATQDPSQTQERRMAESLREPREPGTPGRDQIVPAPTGHARDETAQREGGSPARPVEEEEPKGRKPADTKAVKGPRENKGG